jgi:hypothetical protein
MAHDVRGRSNASAHSLVKQRWGFNAGNQGRTAMASFCRARSVGYFLLAMLPVAGSAQTGPQWRSQQLEASRKSELIMHEAEGRKGLLAQYQVMRYAHVRYNDTAFRLIFDQYLSWYQTYIGDYPDASASFSIKQVSTSDDRASPLSEGSFTAKPALEAIPELAKKYQAVFFNEAHNVPMTRSLTVPLLAKLRQQGFNYFAAETLYQTDTKLQSRGYPIKNSGFYTEEPICAEMVRTALKLGFTVVAYEATSDATGDAREKEQAENLYRAVFKKDPHAKLVLDAGYAHIQKSGKFLDGVSMAQYLHKLSGIDALTVEQTMLFPHEDARDDHPYLAAVIKQIDPQAPTVFVDPSGRPWSLRAGYDVSVFFPAQKLERGRPTWASLGGLRKPYLVSGERCEHAYPCLVEAHYADEGMDAIPADVVAMDPVPLGAAQQEHIRFHQGAPISQLYLRPGKYTLTYTDQTTRLLFQQDVTIAGDIASAPAAPAGDWSEAASRLGPSRR